MTQTLLTDEMIASESVRMLKNSMVMGGCVHRGYDDEFKPKKVGDTVQVRKPQQFTVEESATISVQEIVDTTLDVVITTQAHVAFAVTSKEMTLDIDEYSERIIKPAMNQLANNVDAAGCGQYIHVNNVVGTPGSTPDSFADLALAGQRLDDLACPSDERRVVLNPAAKWGVAGAISGLNIPKSAELALRKGYIGQVAGMDTFMDQNIKSHTTGSGVETSAVSDGATQVGATITTDGWTTGTTLLIGDVLTFAGSYEVNPVSKDTLPFLKQVVVTSDVACLTAATDTDIPISPTLDATGADKNVSSTIADGSAILVNGAASTIYPQNLAFHKNALCLATAPLELPRGAAYAEQKTYEGVSVRVIFDYDSTNDKDICRMDILYGWKLLDNNLITRLIG